MKALSRTYTGELIDLLDPRPEQIHLEDIAHNLSMTCRFAGSVREFYSVAEHSLLVEKLCVPKYSLEALLHDASEAYLSDINGNLKHADEMAGYRAIEKNFEYVIGCKFRLSTLAKDAVKMADHRALEIEGAALIKGWNGGLADGKKTPELRIQPLIRCLSPKEAEKALYNKIKIILD